MPKISEDIIKILLLTGCLLISTAQSYEMPWYVDAINLKNAWTITKGDSNVVVDVFDTGIDNNPALSHSIQPSNSWNFIDNTNKYTDFNGGHGTHVAGLISANMDSAFVGIAPNVKLTSSKVANVTSTAKVKALWDGLVATLSKNKVDVVNLSMNPLPHVRELDSLFEEYNKKGTMIVICAGNKGESLNAPYWDYNNDNVIVVGATNQKNELSHVSLSDSTHVHVLAPGENIRSTFPNSPHRNYSSYSMQIKGVNGGVLSGASQAAAIVSGVVALAKSIDPTIKPYEIKKLLIETSINEPKLYGKSVSNGRIDAYAFLLKVSERIKKGWESSQPFYLLLTIPLI